MSKEETKRAINKSCMCYVWLIGKGEGCDYSIACNECLRPLWAKDLERAKEELAVIVYEYGEIEDAVIIQASQLHVFDIDEHNAAAEAILQKRAKEERDAAEKDEFERLKAKFGETH